MRNIAPFRFSIEWKYEKYKCETELTFGCHYYNRQPTEMVLKMRQVKYYIARNNFYAMQIAHTYVLFSVFNTFIPKKHHRFENISIFHHFAFLLHRPSNGERSFPTCRNQSNLKKIPNTFMHLHFTVIWLNDMLMLPYQMVLSCV